MRPLVLRSVVGALVAALISVFSVLTGTFGDTQDVVTEQQDRFPNPLAGIIPGDIVLTRKAV